MSLSSNDTLTDEQLEQLEALIRVRHTPFSLIHRPTPKQAAFLALDHVLEAFYGGAAGGGKSDALLMAAAQYVDRPGYAALILRRNYKQLSMPGALMHRAHEWWDRTAASWSAANKTWTFPGGGTITFGHVQNPADVSQYESSEFQYCVERGTGIRMGDGSSRPIEQIVCGDEVATLEGPRLVTRAWRVGWRDAVRVETEVGTSTISADHPVLTVPGWVAPRGTQSMPPPRVHTIRAMCRGLRRVWQRLAVSTWPGCWRAPVLSAVSPQSAVHRVTGVSQAGDQTGFGVSGDAPQGEPPPRSWSVPLVLFGPDPQLSLSVESDVEQYGSRGYVIRDSRHDYRPGCCCGDAQSHRIPADVPRCIPRQADAATLSQQYRPAGDPVSTPSCNQTPSGTYCHPYTSCVRERTEDVRFGFAQMALTGVAEMFDLTVEDANHYVLSSSDVIVKNCAFDEVTQFEESVYQFMFSRLRRVRGVQVPLRMRSASNPSGIGFNWVKRRFVSPETRDPETVFVAARLVDNPYLVFGEYVASLSHLSRTLREKLLAGDWEIMESGEMFSPYEWITQWLDAAPRTDINMRVRSWDLAFAAKTEDNDPDWTAGALMSRDARTGMFTIEHLLRFRESSGKTEKIIRATAERDGVGVPVYIEKMPGAGKQISDRYKRQVLIGFTVRDSHPAGMTKARRAEPFAAAMDNGLVRCVRGDWTEDLFVEMTQFPGGGDHDDMVDALVYAYRAIAQPSSTVDEYIPHASMTGMHRALDGRR